MMKIEGPSLQLFFLFLVKIRPEKKVFKIQNSKNHFIFESCNDQKLKKKSKFSEKIIRQIATFDFSI